MCRIVDGVAGCWGSGGWGKLIELRNLGDGTLTYFLYPKNFLHSKKIYAPSAEGAYQKNTRKTKTCTKNFLKNTCVFLDAQS